VHVNALFPHLLARLTEGGPRVLQIATDCAYSGAKGSYLEGDPHDALDVYGKTKSLGETHAEHVHHLRCSIIGPEARAPKSLLGWFLAQPKGGAVNGFVNHRWNGVTTLHFARLCQGVIEQDLDLPHLQHVIPRGSVTKYEILQRLAECYDRGDVDVRPTDAAVVVDRTLETHDEQLNRMLWDAAGYSEPPGVSEMIEELARFDYRWRS
jgi:dTDP-4-dehydrorhamnose reductase